MIKCDNCGNFFTIGNHSNGIPNGIGFVLKNGKVFNMCSFCVSYKNAECIKKMEELEK